MAKPKFIELGTRRRLTRIPILYEDRSVIAIDKPAGWMLVPFTWQRTQRNLQAAITSSLAAGDFWAKCRNLKFLRHMHRLDADTTGILLFAKSQGALDTYSELFESRKMTKTYLAVVQGKPAQAEWQCFERLSPDPNQIGRIVVDPAQGKEAETSFRVLKAENHRSLIEACPVTGRTHQIRVHLQVTDHPVVGDMLYAPDTGVLPSSRPGKSAQFPLGLRAVRLAYFDPFQRKNIEIQAPTQDFLEAFDMA